ncbi:MAG TPA: large conductance mechanosensitive channel protein MscL [Phycisphaerales bacterium]|nr:large conductance mechanosensitive channel protein MscL [Phycisphaerales bacterium]
MGMVKEFREFALKGNVLDLAVGVIIGAAFGTIVNSLVRDVIMPVVGMAGDVNFSDKYIPLSEKARAATALYAQSHDGKAMPLDAVQKESLPVLAYGNFITVTINFVILAFCIFLVVKLFNSARRRFEAQPAPVPAVPPAPTKEQLLLTEIRDLLAARR